MNFFLRAAGNSSSNIISGWIGLGNSIIRGTSDFFNSVTQDIGGEPEYADTCFYYAGTTGPITGIGNSDVPEAVYGSWWPTFLNSLYKLTSRKQAVINRGSGGAEFYPNGDNNNWSATGTLRAGLLTAVNNFLATPNTRLDGIVIENGINDVRGAQSLVNIQFAITDLFTWLDTNFPGVKKYVLNIGSAAGADPARYTAVRGYLNDMVSMFSDVVMINDLANFDADYKDPDGIHYVQEGNERIALTTVKNLITGGHITANPITRTYSTESQDVFNLMPDALTNIEKNWMHDIIQYFVRKGYWTNLNTFQIFRLATQANSLKDWRKAGSAVIGSGTSFSSLNGLETDGTVDGYIRTNLIPSNGAAATNCIFGTWLKEAVGAEGTIMGCTGSTPTNILRMRQVSGGNIEFVVNADNAGTTSSPVAGNHMYALKRTSIGQQGIVTNTVITAHNDNPTARPNTELTLGIHNNNGVFEDPYEGTYWAFFSGVGTNQNHWDIYRTLRRLFLEIEYDLAGV